MRRVTTCATLVILAFLFFESCDAQTVSVEDTDPRLKYFSPKGVWTTHTSVASNWSLHDSTDTFINVPGATVTFASFPGQKGPHRKTFNSGGLLP